MSLRSAEYEQIIANLMLDIPESAHQMPFKLSELLVEGGTIKLDLKLAFPAMSYYGQWREHIADALKQRGDIDFVDVNFTSDLSSYLAKPNMSPLPGIKNIIAVASGKGGVGKSFVSLFLAKALQQSGANVGILDADIYGPSQPHQLGIKTKPISTDGKKFDPIIQDGIQSMSMGYLVDNEDTPMVWRGPMVSKALTQLLWDTAWTDLDYLILDLPPGTGDIQLTLTQKVPLSGAVVVTTPQDIACLDAKKAIKMFEKVQVPVLGVVENMSGHTCTQCGHHDPVFGSDGAQAMAKAYDLALLGQIPLDTKIRQCMDSGKSIFDDPQMKGLAKLGTDICTEMNFKLIQQSKHRAGMPGVVVEHS